MNSDPSDPTYVRSCAHPWHPAKQAIATPVRTDADTAMQHRSANPIKDQTNVLPADAAPVHSRLTSPPRDHRKGFSWVPSLRLAQASVQTSAPPQRAATAALLLSGIRYRRTSRALLVGCTRRGRASRHACACTARASSPSCMTIATDRPAAPARTQRPAVFFARFLQMRTPRHPIRGRSSRCRTTTPSPCLGRDVHAMGTQGTFRRPRRTT
jgi:hypothetical protein